MEDRGYRRLPGTGAEGTPGAGASPGCAPGLDPRVPGSGSDSAKDSPLVKAERLRKSYGHVLAVDNLSFEVHRGAILGLLGPNGAGKSTALRMLVGFQYPDSGSVYLNGLDVYRDGPMARASLGYLPESVPLYAEMEVRAYLRFFARLKGVRSVRPEVDRVVELLNLEGVVGRPCGNLSRGYRQRVGLAQALLSNPDILILDEPTSGLDPNQIHDFRALVRRLGKNRAVLLSTHILPEALEICDRVLILSGGRVAAEGSPGRLAGDDGCLEYAKLRLPASPEAADVERFGLEPASNPATGGDRLFRVRGSLDREASRELLRTALEKDWDLLEWGSGASALESEFRRLTLGEEGPGK